MKSCYTAQFNKLFKFKKKKSVHFGVDKVPLIWLSVHVPTTPTRCAAAPPPVPGSVVPVPGPRGSAETSLGEQEQ